MDRKKIFNPLFILGLLGITLIFLYFLLFPFAKPQSVKAPEPPSLPPDRVLTGKIVKGNTLSSVLRSQNLSLGLVETICKNLKPMFNLRKVKPGDSYEVRLTPEDQLRSFSYQTSPIDIYRITVQPSGDWHSQKIEVPVEKYWARVSGEISSSLFQTMDGLGEQDALVLDFAEIFAWEIDFHSDPQPGDRFQIVVEKYYTGKTFVKYGRILYASYQSGNKILQAIDFHGSGKYRAYYTAKGESLQKAFLRSPLQFTRISSGYMKARRHPILGGLRPHYGVDYAAPEGNPVWAIAEGTITFCGWNGGFGKQVIIKHAGGYQSQYGHLSRIAAGIKKGQKVRQKRVIGYVGSTGLSTGPHLDFRLSRNNVFRNPLREISPRAAPLRKDQIEEFEQTRNHLLLWMNDPSSAKYRYVASLTSKDLGGAKP